MSLTAIHHVQLAIPKGSEALCREAEGVVSTVMDRRPLLTIFGSRNDPFGFQAEWKRRVPHASELVLAGGNHFPLRVITHDAAGKEQMRMEAQKVEKKKLDDARFVPPPDYKQFNPGQMPPIPNLPAKTR